MHEFFHSNFPDRSEVVKTPGSGHQVTVLPRSRGCDTVASGESGWFAFLGKSRGCSVPLLAVPRAAGRVSLPFSRLQRERNGSLLIGGRGRLPIRRLALRFGSRIPARFHCFSHVARRNLIQPGSVFPPKERNTARLLESDSLPPRSPCPPGFSALSAWDRRSIDISFLFY